MSFKDFISTKATCFTAHFGSRSKSHLKGLPLDLLGWPKPPAVHQVRPVEDSVHWYSIHERSAWKHPLPRHIFGLSNAATPSHPIQHKSKWLHHLQEENQVAQHGLCHQVSKHHKHSDMWKICCQTTHPTTSTRECCIAPLDSYRMQQLGHHF